MVKELSVTELDTVSSGAAASYENIESDIDGASGIALGTLAFFAAPEIAVPLAISGLLLDGDSMSYNFF